MPEQKTAWIYMNRHGATQLGANIVSQLAVHYSSL
jgi:hypothetical protein